MKQTEREKREKLEASWRAPRMQTHSVKQTLVSFRLSQLSNARSAQVTQSLERQNEGRKTATQCLLPNQTILQN